MNGDVRVALAATLGNFLHGWDNAAIAGSILYIKKELDLSTAMEGLVVAMSLIGATVMSTCSGPISDAVGRLPMLRLSASLYCIGSLVMLWSPNVYILLLARLLDGFGIGLAVTFVPVYITETSRPKIRGSLNMLPQFTGSCGMFLSYCLIFGMSLMESPSWRIMLGVLGIPSVFYLLFALFYLPESPTWLKDKGRMCEVEEVRRRLQGTEDVSAADAQLITPSNENGMQLNDPGETGAAIGSIWNALHVPGVPRALSVAVGIQMLQQFAGINGVLYYAPQIFKEAGVEVLLSVLGISFTSASFLISSLTTFLVLPFIAIAMRLMDICGKRSLLLATIPVLIASLVTLVISCNVSMESVTHAVITTICVIVYFCTFMMAYGPIPNILRVEIFSTQVRGVCTSICMFVSWTCSFIVTYTLPVMHNSIGLGGIFAIYAAVCVISWVFVSLWVPDTTGMPLDDIIGHFI